MRHHEHKGARIAIIVISISFLVVQFVLNGLFSAGKNAIFEKSIKDIATQYRVEIAPAPWAYSMWGIVYFGQAIMFVYILSTFCREGVGDPLYMSPNLLPFDFYVFYIFTSVFNMTWLFMFQNKWLPAALPASAFIASSLYVCLSIVCKAMDKKLHIIFVHNMTREAWLVRSLVHNPLALYASWVTISCLLTLGSVLVYFAFLDMRDTCTCLLVVLLIEYLVYFFLDWIVLDRYIRYIFTPYVVLIWFLVGLSQRKGEISARNANFTIGLLVIACIAFLVKIVLVVYRHRTRPLIEDSEHITAFPSVPNLPPQEEVVTAYPCVSNVVAYSCKTE